jgi:hypothetical protein
MVALPLRTLARAVHKPRGMIMRYRNRFSDKPRTITVRYAGKCACCGALIAAGEIADYYPARREIAHVGGLDGNSARCTTEIKKHNDFVDIDRMYEDQCADICGR